MNISKNTVLITGGSAGIGFELAKLLTEHDNHVIILGRDQERLQTAAAKLTNVTAIACDVSNAKDVDDLVDRINDEFPNLNVVINNAGRALVYNLATENVNAYDKAEDEMRTNYLSVIRLNEKLLPLLKQQLKAAIVNVSSVVAFVPGSLATYSASKAALHSYTQALRIALQNVSDVKVFELMPPLVDTEFSAPIGGSKGMKASAVAAHFLKSFEQDEYEIRVGQTEDIYRMYLASPEEALNYLNGHRQQVKA